MDERPPESNQDFMPPRPAEGPLAEAEAQGPDLAADGREAGQARPEPTALPLAPEAKGPSEAVVDFLAPPPPPAGAPPAGERQRRLPPSQRWRQRRGRSGVGASVGGHAALGGLLMALLIVAGGPKGEEVKPPLPPGATPTPTPIPVVWVDPTAPATPEPPAPPGDFPVPQSALPSALSSVELSPAPSPEPSSAPSEAPSLPPPAMATPRPLPTLRPLPPVATLPPLRPLPRPRATPARPSPEQRQFATMRRFKYFEDMSDEELRRQPLPPGVSNWEELPKVVGKLNGINWLFLPRQTANRMDGTGSGPNLVPTQPEGMASGASAQPELPATMAEIEPGKPYEELSPEGQHLMVVREGQVFLFASWKTGEADMRVRYRPEGSKPEDPERAFTAKVAPTQAGREQAIREGFVAAAFEDAASATP